MGKAPAFQFYPSDYLRDTRALSLAAKGAWTDMLCYMWFAQNRGELSISMVGLARTIGATVEQTVAIVNELRQAGVCDVQGADQQQNSISFLSPEPDCNVNVTIINRRMSREDKERKMTAYRVHKHREKNSNAEVTPCETELYDECNANVTVPSSSSSSSSCTKVHTKISTNVLISEHEKVSRTPRKINWPIEDSWLKNFLDSQHLLPAPLDALDDPKWWENVSESVNGLTLPVLQQEFAKMGAWLSENKSRLPIKSRGWKKFVRGWLERNADRTRRFANGSQTRAY